MVIVGSMCNGKIPEDERALTFNERRQEYETL